MEAGVRWRLQQETNNKGDNMRDYMNTPQVARLLGVNIQTVRGYIRTGELAAARVGRRYVISRDDIDSFVDTRKEARAAELASVAGEVEQAS